MDLILEMLSYDFMVRALAVGTMVAICAALLGVPLVLKGYSMVGFGLSNTGFAALTVAMALGLSPLRVALPVVLLTALLLFQLREANRLKTDAVVAMVSTLSLALGVMVTALSTGLNVDVCNYLFGTILAMKRTDIGLSLILAALVLSSFAIFSRRIFALIFDEDFALASGVSTRKMRWLLAILTALTIVPGMRLMGTMLISCLMIFPAMTALRLFRSFHRVLVTSVVVALFSFLAGAVLSYRFSLPTGASVVMVNVLLYAAAWIFSGLSGRFQ